MQALLVFIALAIATGYLGYQFYLRFIKKESKCESCAFGKEVDSISDLSN